MNVPSPRINNRKNDYTNLGMDVDIQQIVITTL